MENPCEKKERKKTIFFICTEFTVHSAATQIILLVGPCLSFEPGQSTRPPANSDN